MVNDSVAILTYTNEEGEIVQIPFRGTNTRQVQMDGQYARIQRRLRKVDTYIQERHTVKTMVTCEKMRNDLIALLKSDEPMLYDGNRYKEITIMECDFNDRLPWREPHAFSITYIVTDEDAENFEKSEEL